MSMTASKSKQSILSLPKNTRILLIDNDPDFVSTCENMFAKGGFQDPQVILSFDELMPIVGHMQQMGWTFDIILIEMEMPMISGLEMLTQMKQMVQFKDTPFIMFSKSGSIQHLITGFQTGIDDFIFKPVNPAEMMIRMAKIVLRERALKSQKELLVKAERELATMRLQLNDPTTELSNVYSFSNQLNTRIASDKEDLPFLLLAVDQFEHYLENHGQENGDKCLQAVAGELNKLASEHLIGDLGEGRFGLVLTPGSTLPEVKNLGQELLAHIKALYIPHQKSDGDNLLSLSVGALQVMITKDSPTFEKDVLPLAEQALEQAQASDKHFKLMFETI